MSYSFSVFPVIGSIHVLPVNHETRFIGTFLGAPIRPMRGQERAACFDDGAGSNMVQLWIEFDSCLILWKSQDNWWHRLYQTVRIPVSEWCFLRLQYAPIKHDLDLDDDFVVNFSTAGYCWMLQSILDCVALSQLSWLRSNQSSIALIAPYCVKFLLVFGGVSWGGSIPS